MHRLFVTGLRVVTQAALQPVRLIWKSINRSERFRSRWVAVGLIAGLMALAIGPSAAVALPRDCQSYLNTCTDACYRGYAGSGCTKSCVSSYVQCQDKSKAENENALRGPHSDLSKTKRGPRGSKHAAPVNVSVPNTNAGVLNPNVGGASTANRPPVAQPITGGGLGNATNIPGATVGSSTGAILTPTGPGQGVGSVRWHIHHH
jgi:hypothetical protein